MALARQAQAKTERLEVRLSPATKSLLSHAAQMRHTTVAEFLISSAVRAASSLVSSTVASLILRGQQADELPERSCDSPALLAAGQQMADDPESLRGRSLAEHEALELVQRGMGAKLHDGILRPANRVSEIV